MSDTEPTDTPAAGDSAGLARALQLMASADPPYARREPAEDTPSGPPPPVGDAAPPPYHQDPAPEKDHQAEHDALVSKLSGKDEGDTSSTKADKADTSSDEAGPEPASPKPREQKHVDQLSKVEAQAAAKANGLDDTGTVHELRSRLKAAGITHA